MADNEEGKETTPHGNEWEVVQLTASTYAAAPGPRGDESIYEEKGSAVDDSESESSQALLLSGHFAIPHAQHENLSVEPENLEIQKENRGGESLPIKDHLEEGGKSEEKDDYNWNIKGLAVAEKLPGIEQLIDEKGSKFSIHAQEYEAMAMCGSNIIEEQNIYESIHDERTMGGSAENDETVDSGLIEPSEVYLESSSDIPRSVELGKEDKEEESKLLSGAWWKKRMASLCAHAKDTNAFWSVFVAAAVMGLVMLGQRWQLERWQVMQHRWHLTLTDEKPVRMMGPLSRLKDVMIGGNQRGSYISNAASAER